MTHNPERCLALAQRFEPEPEPCENLRLSPKKLWRPIEIDNGDDSFHFEWYPRDFCCDANALDALLAAMSDEQLYAVRSQIQFPVFISTGARWLAWVRATTAQKCDWIWEALEGK